MAKPLQSIRMLTPYESNKLREALGKGTYTFDVIYRAEVYTMKDKATRFIPAKYLEVANG